MTKLIIAPESKLKFSSRVPPYQAIEHAGTKEAVSAWSHIGYQNYLHVVIILLIKFKIIDHKEHIYKLNICLPSFSNNLVYHILCIPLSSL